MIVTLCGNPTNDADCGYCLQSKDCREVRETICRGCIREGKCPEDFRNKKVSDGMCRGRERAISTHLRTVDEITRLHGKGF